MERVCMVWVEKVDGKGCSTWWINWVDQEPVVSVGRDETRGKTIVDEGVAC